MTTPQLVYLAFSKVIIQVAVLFIIISFRALHESRKCNKQFLSKIMCELFSFLVFCGEVLAQCLHKEFPTIIPGKTGNHT